MALNISIDRGTLPSTKYAARQDIVQQARTMNNPKADKAVGVTVPKLNVNQTGLEYETRSHKGRQEFRFKTGTLALKLNQEILLANDLSACAQSEWSKHEQEHARDNQAIMKQLNAKIKASTDLKGILIEPAWQPRNKFDEIQKNIQAAAGSVFRDLTREAVKKRDTDAEYKKINARIANCEG